MNKYYNHEAEVVLDICLVTTGSYKQIMALRYFEWAMTSKKVR